jgi:hypothetical protein
MRKKMGLLAVLVAGLLLPVGCGGGGGGLEQYISELRGCSADGVGYLIGLTLVIQPVLDAIESGNDVPGLFVEETDAELFIWEFTYEFDSDGDGLFDTTMYGTIDFDMDPSEGIPIGTTSQITWDIEGDIEGGGVFNSLFGASELTALSGFGDLTLPDGCYLEFDIPSESPITFSPNGIIPVADVFGGELYGVLGLYVDTGEHEIESTLTMTMGSNTVRATGVDIDGIGASDFEFDLDLEEERLQGVASCALGTFFSLQEVFSDLLEIVQAATLGGATGDDLVVTPVPGAFPPAWTFTATPTGKTITGTIALGGIPVPNGPISATVTFNYETPEFTSTATAGNPLVLSGTLAASGMAIEDLVAYGRVTTRFPLSALTQTGGELFCDGTIVIPSTNPFAVEALAEGDVQVNPGAIMLLTSKVGNDTLKLSLAAITDGDSTDFGPVGALFNNIPFPFSLLGLDG